MKKVLIGLVVVVVLIGGGVFLLFSNLDKIVETGIETAGTRTLGTPVEVGGVDLDLVGGAASIFDFSIANPVGFSNADMVSFDELSVAINLQDTSSERVHINSVVARSPFVLYETVDGKSNIDAVSSRFSSEPQESESQIMLVIDSIVIENIKGTLNSSRLPSDVDVDLGDIRLSNLEGYPNELAQQIMKPLLSQVGATAAKALVQATTELLGDAANQVGEQLQNANEQLEGAKDQLQDAQDAANETLDKVGNLFKKN